MNPEQITDTSAETTVTDAKTNALFTFCVLDYRASEIECVVLSQSNHPSIILHADLVFKDRSKPWIYEAYSRSIDVLELDSQARAAGVRIVSYDDFKKEEEAKGVTAFKMLASHT